MANRGVFFAIDDLTSKKLLKLQGTARVDFVLSEIEDIYFDNKPEATCETDKAWDAMHRSLTDGNLYWENGEYPLNHLVLGGMVLYGANDGEDDFVIVCKDKAQVQDVAKALKDYTDADFKKGYAQIDMEDYEYQLGFEDLEYALTWFHKVKDFWQKAADSNLNIIFTCAM